MTIFSSFDMAYADEAFSSLNVHEVSFSYQAEIIESQAFSSAQNQEQCPDHCPECHECHFGHCGIILDNKIVINGLNTESNLNKYEQLFMSRDVHSVFRPPIAA